MSKPFQLARKLHLPLYCGEFGIIDKAPIPPKLAWYRDMVSIFKNTMCLMPIGIIKLDHLGL